MLKDIRRHIMMQQPGGGGLPSEYQQVEYLQSSGTQYILLDYVPTSADTIEIVFSLPHKHGTNTLFGRSSVGTNSTYDSDVWNGKFYWHRGKANNSSNYFEMSGVLSENTKYTARDYTDNNWEILDEQGNVKVSKRITTNISAAGTEAYFAIFGTYRYSSVTGIGAVRIHMFTIRRNGDILFQLTPCYRKAENVAGLYDIKNGVFHPNDGTGTFIIGGDI